MKNTTNPNTPKSLKVYIDTDYKLASSVLPFISF